MKRHRAGTVRNGGKRSGDRGSDGRFVSGNRAAVGHGRPVARREIDVALRSELGVEELRRLVRTLFDLALRGDVQAARVLLDRVAGRLPLAAEEQDDDGDGPGFDDLDGVWEAA